MKFCVTKLQTMICLAALILMTAASARAQTDFNAFWKSFKAAVVKKDKEAVAAFVKYPLSMPYGVAAVKNKAAFLKSYEKIFNGEADAAKCFPQAAPSKDDAKNYSVYCGFKETPADTENTPLLYRFELTKSGWRLAGFDNINE